VPPLCGREVLNRRALEQRSNPINVALGSVHQNNHILLTCSLAVVVRVMIA
jgi:hypothetical protein